MEINSQFWAQRRVLITGHTGFKGAWLSLWLQSLGQPAVLPPPEEKKDVKTAIGAARAKASRRPKSGGQKSARSSRGGNGGKKRQPARSGSASRSART